MSNFSIFFPSGKKNCSGLGRKVPESKPDRPLIYCGSKVSLGHFRGHLYCLHVAHQNTHVNGANFVINCHKTCKIIVLHSNVLAQPYFCPVYSYSFELMKCGFQKLDLVFHKKKEKPEKACVFQIITFLCSGCKSIANFEASFLACDRMKTIN